MVSVVYHHPLYVFRMCFRSFVLSDTFIVQATSITTLHRVKQFLTCTSNTISSDAFMIESLKCRYDYTVMLDVTGRVFCAGRNVERRFGKMSSTISTHGTEYPVQMNPEQFNSERIVSIYAGDSFIVLQSANDTLYITGTTFSRSSDKFSSYSHDLMRRHAIKQIACASEQILVLLENGALFGEC